MDKQKRMSIVIPDGTSLNSEEVYQLKRLVEKIPDTSFLGGLLTEDLLNWFESRVSGDWSTDLFSEMEHFETEMTSARGKLGRLQSERERIDRDHDREVTELKKQLARVIGERDDFYLASNEYQQQIGADTRKNWEKDRKLRRQKRALRWALKRFRELAAEHEQKWQFAFDLLKG